MLKPSAEGAPYIASSRPKIKLSSCPPPERTSFDAWLLRQADRLDPVGDFARSVRLVGPGQTPVKLRNHLIGKARCDLATLRRCDQALAEFRALERDIARLNKRARDRGGRRHG